MHFIPPSQFYAELYEAHAWHLHTQSVKRTPASDFSDFCKEAFVVIFIRRSSNEYHTLEKKTNALRAILCKYGASYIGTISRSDSDFDETC